MRDYDVLAEEYDALSEDWAAADKEINRLCLALLKWQAECSAVPTNRDTNGIHERACMALVSARIAAILEVTQ